ncbi:MAG: Uma2 family endonuclease [Caldilineaceae bacterium]
MASRLLDSPSRQLKKYELRPDAPDHGRYVTKEEYWEHWYEGTVYEWNNGYLEAKPMSTPGQFNLYSWFLQLLLQFKLALQSTQIMALETGFTMIVPDPENPGQMKEVTRKPDIGAILLTNPILWGENDRSYHGLCDLCVESMSDSHRSEILRDTEIKFVEYEFAGVKEYYILDPSHRHMHFYVLNRLGHYEELTPDADGVIRSTVLTGFQFRQSDLDAMPSLEELALDEVYQGYVLLQYQAAQHRAMAAEQRADAERKRAQEESRRAQEESRRAQEESRRAQEERQRAERFARKLQELGLNPADLE